MLVVISRCELNATASEQPPRELFNAGASRLLFFYLMTLRHGVQPGGGTERHELRARQPIIAHSTSDLPRTYPLPSQPAMFVYAPDQH